MSYLIQRTDTGRTEYVSNPSTNGTGSSYTQRLEHANQYPTREAAQQEACGNEKVIPLDSVLSPMFAGTSSFT